MGIFDKFKIGFKKSASAFTSGLKEIIVKKEINDENLNKIEEFLIQSDVGVVAASEIKEIISRKKIDPNKDLSKEISSLKGNISGNISKYIFDISYPLNITVHSPTNCSFSQSCFDFNNCGLKYFFEKSFTLPSNPHSK